MLMFRRTLMFVLAVAALTRGGSPAAQTRSVYDAYLEAPTAVMQPGATPADFERLGQLLSDDVIYEHPMAGAHLSGRATILEAMKQHQGETRAASSRILHRIDTANAVAVEEELTFEITAGDAWKRVRRGQVLFLESKDGKLTRVIEYWK